MSTKTTTLRPFNINSHVRVKITKLGLEHMKRKHDELMSSYPEHPFVPPKVDSQGYARMQMHDVMYQFGEKCHNGMGVPIETEILIEFES